jgi:thiamine biosynthesis lipoprotein
MGTMIAHQAFGEGAPDAVCAAKAEVVRLEALLSRFRPTSEVSEVNRRSGGGSVRVSDDTFRVLSQAVEYASFSGGLFDATVGPLLALWRRASEESQPPRKQEIESALALVGHADLVLDPRTHTARLRREGQSVDLGGIGKGYAADRALEVYREHGVSSAFVNLGGNVAAMGTKPDGSPWRVGIRHPRREGDLLGLVSVTDEAVVTSGDYERCFFDRDGVRNHHILDPSKGYPSASGLSSVTIVAESSIAADALSTIVFVAGPKSGRALLESSPGAEAILVDTDMRVSVTHGLRQCFQTAPGVDAVLL